MKLGSFELTWGVIKNILLAILIFGVLAGLLFHSPDIISIVESLIKSIVSGFLFT